MTIPVQLILTNGSISKFQTTEFLIASVLPNFVYFNSPTHSS